MSSLSTADGSRRLTLAEYQAPAQPRRRLTFDELKALEHASSSVSPKVLAHVSPKLSIQRIQVEQSVLELVAKLATRANTAKKRKALAFPSLRRYYAKERKNLESGEIIRKGASYYGDIWKYLQSWAFRLMNDLQGRDLPLPDHAQLEDLFRSRIMERAVVLDLFEKGRPGLTPDTVEHLVEQAALAALRDFDRLYIKKQSERGTLARGKPKPSRRTWTEADLEVLALLDGMPPREQLELLNRGRARPFSRAAYYRLRQALRDRGDASRN